MEGYWVKGEKYMIILENEYLHGVFNSVASTYEQSIYEVIVEEDQFIMVFQSKIKMSITKKDFLDLVKTAF